MFVDNAADCGAMAVALKKFSVDNAAALKAYSERTPTENDAFDVRFAAETAALREKSSPAIKKCIYNPAVLEAIALIDPALTRLHASPLPRARPFHDIGGRRVGELLDLAVMVSVGLGLAQLLRDLDDAPLDAPEDAAGGESSGGVALAGR